ncbi:hypothetical protein CLUG_03531 [Clavispora lusitaniae ATCC 42720]|uniref:Transcription factor n=1 Tax=Clavispora lusitaniae (strain ATCC 42720) TaxID=306902 RepID=C4Y5U7_CLAL4|nr:uncharacterized protein CLUG_03531 [Clavispora lusitaniae ATCC 42720]EEQ39403.1 hypothetical protein CLUG_03531 [Clavispora lusitaniae ATCC 42720]
MSLFISRNNNSKHLFLMTTDSNKVILKANLPRVRDLSFVGRFHHNFGFENDLFEFLLDQKELWGDKLFYINEKQFSNWVQEEKHKIKEVPISSNDLGFADLNVQNVSEESFYEKFGQNTPIHMNFSKGDQSHEQALARGDSVDLHSKIGRNGLALNVGGTITAMKWLPYGDISCLAVFVINHEDGLAASISDPTLSILPNKANGKVKSCIQIWTCSDDVRSMTLSAVYDTTAFGVTKELSWLPVKFSNETIGVLMGGFSDGKLHFYKIVRSISEQTNYYEILEPSFTIAVKDERQEKQEIVPITSYDLLDHTKVIVGTLDGAIAEFMLPGLEDPKTLKIPSFMEYLADSSIVSITIAPVQKSHVLLVNTATTQAFALQYDNLRQGRVESNYTISTLKPLHHNGYRIFVYPDSAESIGYTFVRHPHQKHVLLLRTELVSTFHISEFLNHPFALVGNIMGDVYVMNIGRKIFGVPKANNKLVVPLKLWSLTKDETGSIINLRGDYVPTSSEKSDVLYSFTPPEVVISASAWNETLESSSTYAFGTYTGLLVLERLDPLMN